MKRSGILVVTFGSILSCAIAQEVPELERLEQLYTKELKRVTKPVQEGYRKALARLQKTYTTAARLDDALAVREEIERFDAELEKGGGIHVMSPYKPGDTPPKPEAGDVDLNEWKGDGSLSEERGETILRIKASSSEKQIERSYDVGEFPDGMVLKFSYRSSDYVGTGLKLKGYNTPVGHYHRVIAIPGDGEWREAEWPYKAEQYMEARNIRMVIQVLEGAGDVEFKEIRVEKS
jgi:hypothetical protein